MNKIKYLLEILFLIIILVFTNEMYIWNMDSFETEYISTTMYLPAGTAKEEMLKELEETARKNDLLLFVKIRNLESVFSENITIYGMDGVEEKLERDSQVKGGAYHSLFLGDVHVSYRDFSEISNMDEIELWYIIGNMENARSFKEALAEKYGGNSPEEGYTYLNVDRNLAFLWGVSFSFYFILSLLEMVLMKKEMMLRFIHGEALHVMILKKILINVSTLVGGYGVFFLLFRYGLHLNVDYHTGVSWFCIGLCCFISSMVYVSLLFSDYRKAFLHGKYGKGILRGCYAFKMFSVVLLITTASYCLRLIATGVEYWQQQSFFEEHKKEAYVMIMTAPVGVGQAEENAEKTDEVMWKLLKEKNEEGKTFFSVYLGEGELSGRPCLICNKNMLPDLEKWIPDLKGRNFEKQVYYIVPKSRKEAAEKDAKLYFSLYYRGENSKYETVAYTGNARVLGMGKASPIIADWHKNPCIILDLTDEFQYFGGLYIAQSAMVEMGQEEWQAFVEEEGLNDNSSYLTNVYENYEHELDLNKRFIVMGAALFILMFVLEMILIRTIVYHECQFHSMELAIKTTLGYSYQEKYRKLFLITGITECAAALLCAVLKIASVPGIAFGFLILTIFEAGSIFHHIRRMEKHSINKILKGAML